MSLRLLLGILLLATTSITHAFESWEHKQLADLSYHIAMSIHCKSNHKTEPELCTWRRDLSEKGLFLPYDPLLEPNQEDPYNKKQTYKTTYGDVAMCVDFFLSPDKLIAGRERNLINAYENKNSIDGEPPTEEAPQLFPYRRGQLDLDQLSRCKDGLSNLEGIRAAHVNHTHFQAELLVAQRNNHMVALSMRTMEENLFSALVMNAVSDHFLQDSFAPGHIAAWRSRLTDLAANAYHDRVNREGLDASIPLSELKQLMTVKGSHAGSSDLIELLRQELASDAALLDTFFTPARGNKCTRGCRKEDAKSQADYQTALQIIYECLLAEPNVSVKLRGDNDLWLPQQDEQRFVMLLFEVRSILDILESQPSVAKSDSGSITIVVVDSFRRSEWSWRFKQQENHTQQTRLQKFKGLFDTNWKPSVIKARVGPMSYGNEKSGGVSFSPDVEQGSLHYTSMDQIFGISIGADNMIFGDTQTRYVFNFETVVWGQAKAERSKSIKTANFAATVGIQPYISRDYKGLALGARALAVFPEIETSVSVPVRLMHLQTNNGHSEWLPTIGLRIDAGFTSFLTFYLQANYDAAPQRDGTVRRGPSLGAGIQIAAPRCRIWLLEQACK